MVNFGRTSERGWSLALALLLLATTACGGGGGGGNTRLPPSTPPTAGDGGMPVPAALQIQFGSARYHVAEGGSVDITVTLSRAPGVALDIPLTQWQWNGAQRSDYTLSSNVLTFGASETSTTLTFTAVDNTANDDGRSVTLGFGALPDNVMAASPASTRIALNDDDLPAVTVRFQRARYAVREGERVEIEVILSAPPEAETPISLTQMLNGDAQASDYQLSATQLLFGATETSKTVTLVALDTTATGSERSVALGFDTDALPDRVTTASPNRAVIVLSDLLSVTVRFARATYAVVEGESAEIEIILSQPPQTRTTIALLQVLLEARTSDYQLSTATLTFGPAETSKTLTFTVVDNAMYNGGRRVVLNFTGLPDHVKTTRPSLTTVSLVDNDPRPATVHFSGTNFRVTEGRSVRIAVQLWHKQPQDVVIPIAHSSSGAGASAYSVSARELKFPAGETIQTFVVTALDNDARDDTRTVTLRFGALPSPLRADSWNATAKVTLVDDEPPPPDSGTPPTPPPDPDDEPRPPPEPPSAEEQFEADRLAFHTPEFEDPAQSLAMSAIKADYAYARGFTGKGVTLGIVDTGFQVGHPEFLTREGDSRIDGRSRTLGRVGDWPGCTVNLCILHGNLVAGVAAATRNEDGNADGMHGVAHDATLLLSYRDYYLRNPENSSSFDDYVASNMRFMMNHDIKIVNNSWSYNRSVSEYTEATAREEFANAIAAMAQADVDPADRTIFVWAAGNRRGEMEPPAANPRILASLPSFIEELQAYQYLAVVGVRSYADVRRPGFEGSDLSGYDYEHGVSTQFPIANGSSRCGVVAKWCLAAPFGWKSTSAARYGTYYGTSLATPAVSGALAVMFEAFRGQMGSQEIVKRLLETADKTGIYADESVYGQGLLDLDAATRPVGDLSVAVSSAFAGPRVAKELSALTAATAFGDAFVHGLGGLEIVALDEMDAPFFFDFASLAKPASRARTLGMRVRDFGEDPRGEVVRAPFGFDTTLRARFTSQGSAHDDDAPAAWRVQSASFAANFGAARGFVSLRENANWNFGLHAAGVLQAGELGDEDAFVAPWLSLARDGAAFGLETPLARGRFRFAAFRGAAHSLDDARSTGALFEYANSNFSVQAGAVREDERMIGADAEGAFGELRGATAFIGTTAHGALTKNWSAFASAHLGITRARAPKHLSLIENISTLFSTSFGIGVARPNWLRENDQLTLTLTQPLRVEHGRAQLHWPTGRTRYRELTHARHALNLSPTGRALNFALTYTRPLAHGQLTLASIATRNPGHRAHATPEVTLLLRYAREF